MDTSAPVVIDQSDVNTTKKEAFLEKYSSSRSVDLFADQLKELFEVQHPLFKVARPENYSELEKKYLQERSQNKDLYGSYVYVPWEDTLFHMISKEEYVSLLRNRNQHLISEEEQKVLSTKKIAVTGMSVGGEILTALAYVGIGGSYRIADDDTLSTPNLNRIQYGFSDVGKKKTELASQRVWRLNPYLPITCFGRVNAKSIPGFLGDGTEKVDLLIEEIDDFQMKFVLRNEARKRKIPVIMMTNIGDRILADVERFDLEPELPIFHGTFEKLEQEILSKEITKEDEKRYAIQLVGKEYVSDRAVASVMDIGKRLVGRPQLAGTLMASSGLASYVAREILLGNHLKSGRYFVDLSKIFTT